MLQPQRPRGVPRTWPRMDEIRQEPCSSCGQIEHVKTCLAEMNVRMNYAEQMAKAATSSAEQARSLMDVELAVANSLRDQRDSAIAERDAYKAQLDAIREAQERQDLPLIGDADLTDGMTYQPLPMPDVQVAVSPEAIEEVLAEHDDEIRKLAATPAQNEPEPLDLGETK